jgi:hypothetical protein
MAPYRPSQLLPDAQPYDRPKIEITLAYLINDALLF